MMCKPIKYCKLDAILLFLKVIIEKKVAANFILPTCNGINIAS